MHRKFEGYLSIFIGAIGLVLWLIPIVGICTSLIGLFIGMKAYDSASKHLGIAGIIINILVIILTILRSGLMAMLL